MVVSDNQRQRKEDASARREFEGSLDDTVKLHLKLYTHTHMKKDESRYFKKKKNST